MDLNKFRDVDLVIDKANANFMQRQFVSQGDLKGRTLTVQITDRGVVGEVPGLTLNLRWHNVDSGLTDLSAFECIDKENSLFRIEYPTNMLTPGKVQANIQVIDNGKVTHLKTFELTVQKLAGEMVGLSNQAEYGALITALANVNGLKEAINSLQNDKADKAEIVSSRKPFGGESFTSLGNRLDYQIGKNSEFREFESDNSFMTRVKNEQTERGINVKWFNPNDSAKNAKESAELLSNNIFFPAGTYEMDKFQGKTGKRYFGEGEESVISLSYNAEISNVLGGFESNSEYDRLRFMSVEEDLEWNRLDITGRENVTIKNCFIEGFRHASEAPNAWGMYLGNSKNIKILNCRFEKNSQSDITILDGCENVVIDGCYSEDDTLTINFEPNTSVNTIKNVTLKNMKLKKLYLLNNSLTYDGSENILIENCEIETLNFGGLDADFLNCTIKNIVPFSAGENLFGGRVNWNNALSLSKNLIVDPFFDSYATSENSGADWVAYSSQGTVAAMTTRNDDFGGKQLMIGQRNGIANYCCFKPKIKYPDGSSSGFKLPVLENDVFILTVDGRAKYPTGSSWISLNALVRFYDSADALISAANKSISMFRAVDGSETGIERQVAAILVPENATNMVIAIGTHKATTLASLYVSQVSLQKLLNDSSSSNELPENFISFSQRRVIYNTAAPSSTYGWGYYQKGDICYNSAPSTGQQIGWICTEDGYPGAWKSMGNVN